MSKTYQERLLDEKIAQMEAEEAEALNGTQEVDTAEETDTAEDLPTEPTDGGPEKEGAKQQASEAAPEKVEPEKSEDQKHDWEKRKRDAQEAQRQLSHAQRKLEETKRLAEEAEARAKAEADRVEKLLAKMEALQVQKPAPEEDDEAELPEVARIAEKKAQKRVEPLEKELAEIKRREAEREKRDAEDRVNRLREAAHNTILNAHEDAYDLAAEPEIQDWLESQPKSYRRALFDDQALVDDPDFTIKVLNEYKTFKTPKPVESPKKPSGADVKVPVKQPSAPVSVAREDVFTETEMKNINNILNEYARKGRLSEFEAKYERTVALYSK